MEVKHNVSLDRPELLRQIEVLEQRLRRPPTDLDGAGLKDRMNTYRAILRQRRRQLADLE